MRIRGWSKHIIVRFGRDFALKFAMTIEKCPCSLTGWSCKSCSYSQVNYGGEKYNCTSVKEWLDLSHENILKIKKRIVKDLKKSRRDELEMDDSCTQNGILCKYSERSRFDKPCEKCRISWYDHGIASKYKKPKRGKK